MEQIEGNPHEPVCIHTDSKYLINAQQNWIPKWKQTNWITSTGTKVQNQDLFERLDSLCSSRSGPVVFRHIAGHSGNAGNEAADQLAVRGAEM